MSLLSSPLAQSLDASLNWSALYPARNLSLSNHLPMVLTALSDLGAPADLMARWVRQASSRLVESDAVERNAVQAMEQALSTSGLDAVLRDQLPSLLTAPETSAFHGLIRLACGLVADHAGEQARAFAAWHRHRLTLGPPPHPGGQASNLRALLARAGGAAELAFTPRSGTTIVSDLRACVALPGFDQWVSGEQGPHPTALSVEALAEASLAVYLASRDFTALHLVTALHAWRVVTTWNGTSSPSRPGAASAADLPLLILWRAWLAAWVSIGRPVPDWDGVHAGSADEDCWTQARAALLASTDEHRIKLAWSARAEWRHRGWPGYARVLETPP